MRNTYASQGEDKDMRLLRPKHPLFSQPLFIWTVTYLQHLFFSSIMSVIMRVGVASDIGSFKVFIIESFKLLMDVGGLALLSYSWTY